MTGPDTSEDQPGADAAEPAITGGPEFFECVPGRCQAPAGMNLGCDQLGCQKTQLFGKWQEALQRARARLFPGEKPK